MADPPYTACTSASTDGSPCSEINGSKLLHWARRPHEKVHRGAHVWEGTVLYLCIPVNSTSWLDTISRLHTKNLTIEKSVTITIDNQNYSSCWTDLSDQNLQVNSAGNLRTSCDRVGQDYGRERTWFGDLGLTSIVSVQKSVFAESLQHGNSQWFSLYVVWPGQSVHGSSD